MNHITFACPQCGQSEKALRYHKCPLCGHIVDEMYLNDLSKEGGSSFHMGGLNDEYKKGDES